MPKLDLVLLHAPSVYDFRERPAMYGPISDVIPSTPVFEMYPLGFVSMVGYLEQQGLHARIINLAVKMLKHPRLDVERLIAGLDAKAFGFDLHWLAHAAGSLDLAEIVKEHHSDRPVILGGLSASFYHDEIIKDYPQVDYVLRGDTVEKPLFELMECIEGGREPADVENLTWRDGDGRTKANPLNFVPDDIDDLWVDYGEVVKLVVRHMDLESTLPYENFMEYPFTAVLTCKGCNYNCVTCGGSCYSFSKHFGRDGAVMKSPDKLVEEMVIVSEYFKAPIFLIGDLRQSGTGHAEEALEKIRAEGLDNTITYELFEAVPEDYMKKIARSADSWTLEISPESHDDGVRGIMGKPYTAAQMERTIKLGIEHGCSKFDVYFMVGLSGQTSQSALDSVEYSRRLYERFGGESEIYTFIAPMAPFLDPGSMIFDDPGRYGFTQLYRTLGEHKQALYQPSWKLYLSYHTDWMTRDDVAETTYEAMIRMNRVKAEAGVTDVEMASRISFGLNQARDVMRSIDAIIASTRDESERAEKYGELRRQIEDSNRSTGYAKRELRMPGTTGIRLKGALKYLLRLARLSK
ncbi:MAG: TIGR04190 family B12-binding domain/radical SAM domain protein [Candidatus Bathyarchaeota archaeon]|nr:MAG: TIGR04190 family B12-binding domain/radical SAM domain protein [Candidatus Bathyarchaeota archaeon]